MNAFSYLLVIARVAGDQKFVMGKDKAEKSSNRLLQLLILKSSRFHGKAPVLKSPFNKDAGLRAHIS